MRQINAREFAFLYQVDQLADLSLEALGLSARTIVEEMHDGGMGSLSFPLDESGSTQDKVMSNPGSAKDILAPHSPEITRRMGSELVVGEFNDEDGVLVSFTLNLDQRGALFELDLWKTDFMPLKRLPSEPHEIRILTHTQYQTL